MKKTYKKLVSLVLSAAVLLSSIGMQSLSSNAAEKATVQEGIILTPKDVKESSGNLNITDEKIGGTSPGSWVKYEDVDFGSGTYNKIAINAETGSTDTAKKIYICIDDNFTSADGIQIAEFCNSEMTPSGWSTMYRYEKEIASIEGTHDVYVYFTEHGAANLGNVEFFYRDDSDVAELSEIKVGNGYNMDNTFSTDEDTYNVWVSTAEETVTISAKATVGVAVVSINGTTISANETYSLGLQNNTDVAEVKVTSKSGDVSKTYKVNFNDRTDAVTETGVSILAEQASAYNGAEQLKEGSWLRYDDVSFNQPNILVLDGTMTQESGGTVEVYIDQMSAKAGGTLIATVNKDNAKNEIQLLERELSGKHDVYFVFHGNTPVISSFDKFTLQTKDVPSADLSNIVLGNDLSLDKNFRYNVTVYNVYVPSVFNKVSIAPEVYKTGKAEVTVDGMKYTGTPVEIELDEESEIVEIQVTSSEDANVTKTYTLTLTRTPETKKFMMDTADILNSENDTWEDGWVNPGDWAVFKGVDLSGYNVILMDMSIAQDSTVIEYYIDCELVNGYPTGGTRIAVFDNLATGASLSNPTVLKDAVRNISYPTYGIHDIYIKIDADTFGMGNLYSFTLSYDANVKGSSALLGEISGYEGTIAPAFNPETYHYVLTVDNDLEKLPLFIPAADKYNATTKINGAEYNGLETQYVDIQKNVTDITITVTSEDNQNTKEYTLTIYRKYPSNVDVSDIYVSTNGNKENSGLTADEPLDSIYHALAIASEGTTIHLAEGTYTLDNQITLKSGVSIKGAGVDKTIVESKLAYPGANLDDRLVFGSEGYLFAGDGIEDVTISNMKLVNGFYNINQNPEDIKESGGSDLGYDSAHAAIHLNGVNNVNVHDIYFDSFNFVGIFMGESTNTNIYQCTFYNTSRADQNSCKGAVTVDNISDCTIHDNIFRDNRGGYGIKSYPAGGITRTTSVIRLKVYNNDFELRQAGGWLAGTWAAGNFSIELWNAKAQEVDIYNNKFADGLSLVCNEYYYSEPYSYKIYNNLFLHKTMKSYTCSMSMEFGITNAEVFNNYFEHGTACLQVFHGHTYEDIKVYNNVFAGQELTSIVSYAGAVQNFDMYNNLIYLDKDVMQPARPADNPNEGMGYFSLIRVDGKGGKNLNFSNNVLVAETDGIAHDKFIVAPLGVEGLKISNNTFFNWSVEEDDGTSNITADPLLDLSDMRLAYNSPAFSTGYKQIDLTNTGIMEDAFFSPDDEPFRRIFLLEEGSSDQQNLIAIDGRNDSVQLTIKGITENGYIKSNVSVDSYEVDVLEGENVVTVSENGVVTPVSDGIVKVTAKLSYGEETISSSVYIEVSNFAADTEESDEIPEVKPDDNTEVKDNQNASPKTGDVNGVYITVYSTIVVIMLVAIAFAIIFRRKFEII